MLILPKSIYRINVIAIKIPFANRFPYSWVVRHRPDKLLENVTVHKSESAPLYIVAN